MGQLRINKTATVFTHHEAQDKEATRGCELSTRFRNGDFKWIVETDEVPFWEKAPYLLFLFAFTQMNPEKIIYFFERATLKEELPEVVRIDLGINLIAVYVYTGRFAEARERFKAAQEAVAQHKLEGLLACLRVSELYLHLSSGNRAVIEASIAELEEWIQQVPDCYELGRFQMLKGVCHLVLGHEDGERLIEEGIEKLRGAESKMELVAGVGMVLRFLNRYIKDPELLEKYKNLWEEITEPYQFDELRKKVTCLLLSNL